MPVRRTDNIDAAESAIVAAFSTALMSVAQSEQELIETNWDKQQDALGRPWAPLAASTIRKKGHSRILVESGDMRESVYSRRQSAFQVEIGVADPKIHIHEYGTEHIPPRKVIEPAKVHLRQGRMQSALSKEIARSILALRFSSMVG